MVDVANMRENRKSLPVFTIHLVWQDQAVHIPFHACTALAAFGPRSTQGPALKSLVLSSIRGLGEMVMESVQQAETHTEPEYGARMQQAAF